MIDHRSYTQLRKFLKNSGLNGIRTHDLYDTGAMLCQQSCEYIKDHLDHMEYFVLYAQADNPESKSNT